MLQKLSIALTWTAPALFGAPLAARTRRAGPTFIDLDCAREQIEQAVLMILNRRAVKAQQTRRLSGHESGAEGRNEFGTAVAR